LPHGSRWRLLRSRSCGGRASRLIDRPKNVLVAGRIEPERDVDGLVFDHPLVADFDPQCVEKYHRINRVKGATLPFPDFVQDRIRNLADEVGRNLGAVEFGQMASSCRERKD
jgi:hypothetical protein